MILLRFILLLVLAFYLLRVLFRWILGSPSARRKGRRGGTHDHSDRRFSELTDQEIEDADFEEIKTGES